MSTSVGRCESLHTLRTGIRLLPGVLDEMLVQVTPVLERLGTVGTG